MGITKATELNVDTIYLVSTGNCVAKYDDKKLQSKVSRWEKNYARSSPTVWTQSTAQHL